MKNLVKYRYVKTDLGASLSLESLTHLNLADEVGRFRGVSEGRDVRRVVTESERNRYVLTLGSPLLLLG